MKNKKTKNKKNLQICIFFLSIKRNDNYVIYSFIECGYHTLLIIWHVFYYFFVNTKPNFGMPNFRMRMRKIWAIYCYQNLTKVEVTQVVKKKWSGKSPLSSCYTCQKGGMFLKKSAKKDLSLKCYPLNNLRITWCY